jgi:hypothetical protein
LNTFKDRGYTTPNLEKFFPTMDEFINSCIEMCPIVDVKNNVVYLKQVRFLKLKVTLKDFFFNFFLLVIAVELFASERNQLQGPVPEVRDRESLQEQQERPF